MQTYTERAHLEPDEIVLRTVRKHWFILLERTIGTVLLFLVPVVGYVLLSSFDPFASAIAALPHTSETLLFAISFWFLLCWMMLFSTWNDYYLDMWTITTKRIIAVDQRGMFTRSIASFRYERLQDVTIDIPGFIATMLDFGNIHAQTAGHDIDFAISGIPKPRDVKSLILQSAEAVVTERYKTLKHAVDEDTAA